MITFQAGDTLREIGAPPFVTALAGPVIGRRNTAKLYRVPRHPLSECTELPRVRRLFCAPAGRTSWRFGSRATISPSAVSNVPEGPVDMARSAGLLK